MKIMPPDFIEIRLDGLKVERKRPLRHNGNNAATPHKMIRRWGSQYALAKLVQHAPEDFHNW